MYVCHSCMYECMHIRMYVTYVLTCYVRTYVYMYVRMYVCNVHPFSFFLYMTPSEHDNLYITCVRQIV